MVEISTDTMDLLNPTADKELQTDSVAEVKPQVVIEYRELPKPVMLDKAILVCPASREVASGLDEVWSYIVNIYNEY